MKTLRYLTRRSATALLFLGLALPVPAAAGQVTVYQDYYEDRAFVSCASETCHLEFSAVPRLTLITKVNCLVRGNEDLREIKLGVQKTVGLVRYEHLPVVTPAIFGGTKWYSILAPTDFLFGPGAIPAIESLLIDDASGGLLDCKITGRFWPPNAAVTN